MPTQKFLPQNALAERYDLTYAPDGFVETELSPFCDLHWTVVSAWDGREHASQTLNWGDNYSTLLFDLSPELRAFWRLPPNAAAFTIDCENGEPLGGLALTPTELSELKSEYASAITVG